jgi:tRNA-dihydrouridine synthase A
MTSPAHIFSVAPMIDWTDRHCRYFHRRLTRAALLYTEMVTAPALVRGGALHLLDRHGEENPVALQLGGSEAGELAKAARLGAARGYDEINLNIGCPSDRVQSGAFGAVLMRKPQLVADCVRAMQAAVDVAVTVKCRIGVDDQDPGEALPTFLDAMQGAGVTRVIVHARKAWLQGLSPAQNREIPPLDYDLVAREAAARPDLRIVLNGGITSLDQAEAHLGQGFAGVMLGRAAYQHPGDILLDADRRFFDRPNPCRTPVEAVLAMRTYIQDETGAGTRLSAITRHMLGVFSGRPGARHWRRHLSEHGHRAGAGWSVVEDALAFVADRDAAA